MHSLPVCHAFAVPQGAREESKGWQFKNDSLISISISISISIPIPIYLLIAPYLCGISCSLYWWLVATRLLCIRTGYGCIGLFFLCFYPSVCFVLCIVMWIASGRHLGIRFSLYFGLVCCRASKTVLLGCRRNLYDLIRKWLKSYTSIRQIIQCIRHTPGSFSVK